MTRIQITIVPKEIGDIFDNILDDMLNALTRESSNYGNLSLRQLIPHHFYSNYNVYQGECYKQYTSNLCGYHATFNALCCLHMYLNLKSQYVINCGASFWKFKKKVEKFLFQIKTANKLQDQWPWRQKDIIWGDFQRTYNKICIELFDDFDIFKQKHQDFTYMNFTWEFQYENLLISQQGKVDLNNKIKMFQNYKGEKPLIFGIMLGITCHWTVLMAFKSNNKTEYWFFDSRAQHLLDYNQEQIQKYIEDYEAQRMERKKPKLTNFQKEKLSQSIKDSQISIKLIIDCLEGKASIDQYAYNRLLNVFAKPLEEALKTGSKTVFSQTIKDYWHNISAFFNKGFFGRSEINWGLLTEQSKARIRFLYQASVQARSSSPEVKSLYQIFNSKKAQIATY